jgi:hypothetical protein
VLPGSSHRSEHVGLVQWRRRGPHPVPVGHPDRGRARLLQRRLPGADDRREIVFALRGARRDLCVERDGAQPSDSRVSHFPGRETGPQGAPEPVRARQTARRWLDHVPVFCRDRRRLPAKGLLHRRPVLALGIDPGRGGQRGRRLGCHRAACLPRPCPILGRAGGCAGGRLSGA